MEHTCHQCGASVEEGVVFCPRCAAPQIRVSGSDSATLDASLPHLPAFRGSFPSGQIQWSQALPGAVIGGLVSAVLTLFGALGLGMLVGGALSVMLYHRRSAVVGLSARLGWRLGAASGVSGFSVFTILGAAEMLVRHSSGEFRAELFDALQQSATRSTNPDAQAVVNWVKTPPGFAFMVTILLVVMFVFFVIFSGLGGALGAALLRRKERP